MLAAYNCACCTNLTLTPIPLGLSITGTNERDGRFAALEMFHCSTINSNKTFNLINTHCKLPMASHNSSLCHPFSQAAVKYQKFTSRIYCIYMFLWYLYVMARP